jgi:hypothetical protein
MTTRPILFNGAMVRAILSGAKTQTRRIVTQHVPKDIEAWNSSPYGWVPLEDSGMCNGAKVPAGEPIRCPFGAPGDRLWVRERACVLWWSGPSNGDSRVCLRYAADGAESEVVWPSRLLPPIVGHCIPNGVHREGARIFLEVESVRVERLHDISEEDARSEGLQDFGGGDLAPAWWHSYDGLALAGATARQGFQLLWESINGPGSWEANPWTWVVEFRRVGR